MEKLPLHLRLVLVVFLLPFIFKDLARPIPFTGDHLTNEDKKDDKLLDLPLFQLIVVFRYMNQ